MQTNKKNIYDEIRKIAIILGEPVTEERIKLYVEILSKYDFEKVIHAIRSCAINCKFFPKPSEILELVNPKINQADVEFLVGEIIKSVRIFGWSRGDEAQKFLGLKAWEAINKIGGWITMCETPQNDLPTLRAQLRGACLASLNEIEIKQKLKGIESRENKLIEAKNLFLGGKNNL